MHTVPDNEPAEIPSSGTSRLYLRALHSLSAVLLGAYILLQLTTHAKALGGAAAHQRALAEYPLHAPWMQVSVIILGAVHILLGLAMQRSAPRETEEARRGHLLRRVSGIITVAFLGLHLVLFELPIYRGHLELVALPGELVAQLSSTSLGMPWLALIYIVGLAACAAHGSQGLLRLLNIWGLTPNRRSRRTNAIVVSALGGCAFLLATNTVVALATGWSPIAQEPLASDATLCDQPLVGPQGATEAPSPP